MMNMANNSIKTTRRTSNTKSTKLYKFKVGDIVESSFGKVVYFDYSKSHFPLMVEFDREPGKIFYFTPEGFYEMFNDKPDIKLVEDAGSNNKRKIT